MCVMRSIVLSFILLSCAPNGFGTMLQRIWALPVPTG